MAGSSGPGVLVVLFTPRAMRELLAAARWWRKNRLEAPRLLDKEIERALRRIAVFPRSAPLVRGRDVRRVVLRNRKVSRLKATRARTLYNNTYNACTDHHCCLRVAAHLKAHATFAAGLLAALVRWL